MGVKALNPTFKDRTIRKSKGDRFGATDDHSSKLDDPVINGGTGKDAEQEKRYAILAATVDQDIRAAIQARETSGIEDIWAEDDDQYNGVDELSAPFANVKTRDQVPRQPVQSPRSKVFVPITKPKTDIGVARVSEMLLPNDDKPWDMEPTPIPELDEMISNESTDTVELGDGTQAPAIAVALMHKAKAKEFAEAEALWIEDKFAEGDVYSEMRQVLRDAGRIGTGVIKGPTPVRRISQKWKMVRQTPRPPIASTDKVATPATGPQVINKQKPVDNYAQTPIQMGVLSMLQRVESIEPTSICIRAQDCYPDPSCGDSIHKGAFFVERAWLTGKDLKALAFLPGYDAKCIVDGLREGPQTYKTRYDNKTRPQLGDTLYESKLFEVFYYYGDASPEDLELLMARGNPDPKEPRATDDGGTDDGTTTGPEDDLDDTSPLSELLTDEDRRYLRSVPVKVTMLNGRPIKADLNPMEVGGFPYDFFAWEPVKGQPWGRGIPRKMAVAQRILNASVRALLENAGLSSGPQIVTMKGHITPWNNARAEVRGRMGWDFTPPADTQDPDVRKAFMVENIPSTQEEMMGIVQFALELADLLTNLPMLMQGDQQAGTSPETLGGMKLLFNNAMSPLRVIAKWFDDKFMGPHIKRYHDYGMEKGPDNIKGGDSRIVTKGSTALIQREEGREFLMQVFPVKDDPTLRIDPAKLIVEMARSNGFDMSRVQFSEDEWKAKQKEAAANPPPPAPVVEAAQIRVKGLENVANINAGTAKAEQEHKAAMLDLDRKLELAIKEVDKQIAIMTLSGKSHESLTAIKAELAKAAMDNRMKADEMNFKLDPANQSHLGI